MFTIPNLKPVAFYGYPSIVSERIFEIDCINSDRNSEVLFEVIRFQKKLVDLFQKYKINAFEENKTVFEFEGGIFYGFYDLSMVIGKGYKHMGESAFEPEPEAIRIS